MKLIHLYLPKKYRIGAIIFFSGITIIFFCYQAVAIFSSRNRAHVEPVNKVYKASKEYLITPSVTTLCVNFQQTAPNFSVVGTVVAGQKIELASEISGIIEQINFNSAQWVEKGQPLILLKSAEAQAQLAQARAKYLIDKELYLRKQRLLKGHFIAVADISASYSQMKQDSAVVDYQKSLLEKHIIRAPFSGVIGICLVNTGGYLTAGQIITHLVQLRPLYVDFIVTQRLINQIHLHDTVIIHSPFFLQQQWRAKIIALDNIFEENTHSMKIRAEITDQTTDLFSGMAVTIEINQRAEKQIIVPQSAVSYSALGSYLYVVDAKQRVHQRFVKIGMRKEDEFIILSGLQAGETIVLLGAEKLSNNMLVATNQEDSL